MLSIFQSTPSWEGEQDYGGRGIIICDISIHSLVRGRTVASKPRRRTSNGFQSTPSWEGELSQHLKWLTVWKFQSTPSWEGEHTTAWLRECINSFQSTPSWEGEPTDSAFSNVGSYDFNPLPRERENSRHVKWGDRRWLFQSTPSWEGEPINRGYIL